MNNIGRMPKCTEHFNYKICFADTTMVEGFQNWLKDQENTVNTRMKRDCLDCKPESEKDLITDMLQLVAGAMCAGQNCFRTLWLYRGPSDTDNNDLQYCTSACWRSRCRREKDYHINKLHIIQLCLEEKYNLHHVK